MKRQTALTIILCLLVAVWISGCTHVRERVTASAHVGAQFNPGGVEGSGPLFMGSLTYRVSERTSCAVTHISFIFKGPPFSAKSDEDTLNTATCGVSFGGDK